MDLSQRGFGGMVYKGPMVLSPSSDLTISAIVAEIPFFSIGVLALAVFSSFVFLKRVTLASTFLCTACFFAFLGSTFDLSQILVRGSANGPVNQLARILVVSREVFFALSGGFRFLFFWAFVATRPRGESSTGEQRRPLALAPQRTLPHSAAWARWGTAGALLKYILLADIAGIIALQLVWRIISIYGEPRTSIAYFASAGLEIGVAAVFVCKLMVNIAFTSVTPRISVAKYYIFPVIGLFFSIGISVGQIVCFAFTETILGRFFQAVQLYILVLFVLVGAFIPPKEPKSSTLRPVLPLSLERASTFRVTLPGSLAGSPEEQAPPLPLPPTRPPRPPPNRRRSSGARSSGSFGWITRRSYLRNPPPAPSPYDDDNERLWMASLAERGESPESYSQGEEKVRDEDNVDFKQSPRRVDPVFLSSATKSPPETGSASSSTSSSPDFTKHVVPPAAVAEGDSSELVPQTQQRPETVVSEDWNITVLSPDGQRVPSTVISRPPPSSFAQSSPLPARSSSLQRRSFLSLSTTEASTPSLDHTTSDQFAPPPLPTQARVFNEVNQLDPVQTLDVTPPRRPSSALGNSPVYGLSGLRVSPSPARTPSPIAPSPVPRASILLTPSSPVYSNAEMSARNSVSSSETGIQEILRQQQELERSIAKLRILNPRVTDATDGSNPGFRESLSPRSMAHQSTSTVLSLSEFPAPPWERTGTPSYLSQSPELSAEQLSDRGTFRNMAPPSALAQQIARPSRSRQSSGGSADSILVPPKIPFIKRRISVPGSPRASVETLQSFEGSGSRARFDSQGTQYEITSFIGGLSTSGAQSHRPSDSESDSDNPRSSVVVTTAERTSAAKATLLSPVSMAPRRPSGLRNVRSGEAAGSPPHSPGNLNEPQANGTSAGLPANNQRRMASSGGRYNEIPYMPPRDARPLAPTGGRVVGLPARPKVRPDKSMISSPRPLSALRTGDRMFERPRPVPLTIDAATAQSSQSRK